MPARSRLAPLQLEEPVAASGRTHGRGPQADIRFGHRHRPDQQLYGVHLTSGYDRAVSALTTAPQRYRPQAGTDRKT